MYDGQRQLHQAQVCIILEVASLKEETGKELRYFHETVHKHLRALTAMDYKPSDPLITSFLELKLNPNTTLEWQRYSQSSKGVPDYKHLLEFINLRAQASETSLGETKRSIVSNPQPHGPLSYKQLASFTSTTTPKHENERQ